MSGINISFNPLLSNCHVKSICDYLASPSGTIEIHNNNTDCNSQTEVESLCNMEILELTDIPQVYLFPNPANQTFTIESTYKIKETIIYNHLGQQLIQPPGNQSTINISGLSDGLYIVEVVGEGWRVRKKLLVR